MFHPACLHHRRRNGTGSDSLPEKIGKPAQRTSEWALLHSDGMAPVRHIVLSSEVELSLHSRLPQTWPDRNSKRTRHLRSGHVSTHCGQLGLIHHFLYAQPTPVDIRHWTKFLLPFIYPFLIWSTTSFFCHSVCYSRLSALLFLMPSSLFCMLSSPLCIIIIIIILFFYYYYYYFIIIIIMKKVDKNRIYRQIEDGQNGWYK